LSAHLAAQSATATSTHRPAATSATEDASVNNSSCSWYSCETTIAIASASSTSSDSRGLGGSGGGGGRGFLLLLLLLLLAEHLLAGAVPFPQLLEVATALLLLLLLL
jgi:hypothetical protein